MENSKNRSQSRFWFRQKTYGYGVTPCSWEGWLITLLLTGLIGGGVYVLFGFSEEPPMLHGLYFFFYLFALVLVFFRFTASKTKGELRWRWGKNDLDD